MRSRLSLLAIAVPALLAFSCSEAPPPAAPGGPTTAAPPAAPSSPPPTAPGSVPGTPPGGTREEPPPPPSGPPTSPSLGSPVADYHDVIRLYRANLSEDFIIDQIRREHRAYRLDADDVITLRNAGVSERVIQAMLDTGGTAVEPRRSPEERVEVGAYDYPSRARRAEPRLPNTATPGIEWDGLERREDGLVLFHDRWHVGTLTLEGGQLRWVDARDATRNLLIPVSAIAEQFVTCLKRPGGNECFEWGIRTAGGETYRFRDVGWQQGIDARAMAVHQEFVNRFPSLVDSERDVDEKER